MTRIPTTFSAACVFALAMFGAVAPASSADKPSRRINTRGPLKMTHGELFFTRAQIRRAKTSPACASLRKTLMRVADETLKRKPLMGYLSYDKRVKTLTVAYLMTGEKKYFSKVMDYLAAVSSRRWKGDDLTHSHYLIGTAFAYDMLYHELEPALRGQIRDLMLAKLDAHFNTKVYYYYFDTARTKKKLLTQNHLWWANNSIYQAAVALRDEIPPKLRDLYINNATTLLADKAIPLLARDGSGQEGTSYSMYGLHALLTFMETKRINEGVDLYGTTPYFRRIMYYINNLMFPGAPPSYVNTGDATFGAMNRPPTSLYFRLADEFKDPVLQHFGYTFHTRFDRYGDYPTSQLLWYNPALPPQPPTHTPKAVLYKSSGDVVYRTDWSDSALYLNFICSPHKVGHNHPDQNHFILAHKGNHLLVDQGYSYWKNTQEHSTLTVDGYGQFGENYKFIGNIPQPHKDGVRDFFADDAAGYVHFTGDASTSYRPQCALKLYKRHVAALGNIIALFDRVKTKSPKSMAIRFHNATIYPIRYATYDATDHVNRFSIAAPNDRAVLTVKDSQLSFYLDQGKQTEINPTVIMHFAGHPTTTPKELSGYIYVYLKTHKRKVLDSMRVSEVFEDFTADGKPPTPHGFHLVQSTTAPTTNAVFSNLLVVKDTGAADPQVTRIEAESLSGFQVVEPKTTAIFLFNTSDDLDQPLSYNGIRFKGRMVTVVKDTATGAVRRRYTKKAELSLR